MDYPAVMDNIVDAFHSVLWDRATMLASEDIPAMVQSLRCETNVEISNPVDLFYLFICVCSYDLELVWATRLICIICSFVYVLMTQTNLGYPVDLFDLFILVCCYDLQLIWATRLICFICLLVYVLTTYN